MNNISTLITYALMSVLLISCANSDGPFTAEGGGGAISTGVVSSKGIDLKSSESSPTVVEGNTFTTTTLDLTVTISDRNQIIINTPKTIHFRAEWGIFSDTTGNTCITSAGQCSVSWTSSDPGDVPADLRVRIVAYTVGEESFSDLNDNNIFDDADGGSSSFTDTEEPFLDTLQGGVRNGIYDNTPSDTGVSELIDTEGGSPPEKNQMHDPVDNFYNGPACQHTTLCHTEFFNVVVWDSILLDINGDVDNPTPP